MGVMLQAFYWDYPREEKKDFKWWKHVSKQIPALAEVGFTSLWLPPIHKAANLGGFSMGYDPYDYYDLGEFDQKGSVPTWFGTNQIAWQYGHQKNCATWIRMPVGEKTLIMAGCMVITCI